MQKAKDKYSRIKVAATGSGLRLRKARNSVIWCDTAAHQKRTRSEGPLKNVMRSIKTKITVSDVEFF